MTKEQQEKYRRSLKVALRGKFLLTREETKLISSDEIIDVILVSEMIINRMMRG